MKTILFIGAGNVAWHLASIFVERKYHVSYCWSNTASSALALADKLNLSSSSTALETKAVFGIGALDFAHEKADLAILCVADGVYEQVLRKLKLPPNCLLVHTSGAQPMEILKVASPNVGVFYPLQTFSKAKNVNFREIPLCIESNVEVYERQLLALARQFSDKVFRVSSEDRRILHVAAVFACNFANHLWSISQQILEDKRLPFDMLKPLLEETLQKALAINPSNAQTGPAIRRDTAIIEAHKQFLNKYPVQYRQIYELITASIQETSVAQHNKIDL